MITRITNARSPQFSDAETIALQSLRTRYQTDHGLFSARELAHLRFLRWLVQSPNWNRAMDQPYPSVAGSVSGEETGLWTPGCIA